MSYGSHTSVYIGRFKFASCPAKGYLGFAPESRLCINYVNEPTLPATKTTQLEYCVHVITQRSYGNRIARTANSTTQAGA